MRVVVSLGFVVCVASVYLQGCFLQDFNAHARQAGYNTSSSKPSSKPTSFTKKADSTRVKAPKSSAQNSSRAESSALGVLLSQQKQWQFTPYVSGGVKKSGADCSGFVQSVFSESFSVQLPRTTIDQMNGGKKLGGKQMSQSKLRTGDLVFFKTGRGALGYHVGIYLENGEFLHLSAKGGAKIASLSNSYWSPKFIKAVRYDMP
ncbi:C40 family peptidase [Helicobacter canis]|uniref:C40 family peptidase n=1 Tax=Helicobacter canis TaxID=29419 RepID=UPI0029422788|nr:NlpC/P60 family protein [Helicobacter canis]